MSLDYRRPDVSVKDAEYISKALYKLTAIEEVKEFASFSDRNFYIKTSSADVFKSEAMAIEGEFVLKVLNSVDSQNLDLVEAENSALDFLRQRGFPCPEVCCIQGRNERAMAIRLPIRDRYTEAAEQNKSLTGETERCVVRLVTLVPGKTLNNFILTPKMLNLIGEFIGSVSKTLVGFRHHAIATRYDRCDLKNFLDLEPYVSLVSDSEERKIVREIFAAFSSEVSPYTDEMRHGTIHNDMNTVNLLGVTGDRGSLSITGLIDFGDIAYSMVVNDIVVGMESFMACDQQIEVSGHLLAGYQATFPIPATEYKMLYFLIAARVCQLFLISKHSLTVNNENSYVQGMLKSYRQLMKRFWNYPKEKVENIWLKCQESYTLK